MFFHCLYLAGSNCAEDVNDAVGLLLTLLGVLLAEQLAAARGQKQTSVSMKSSLWFSNSLLHC